MTLQVYTADRFDHLALRAVDIAAMFRDMARHQELTEPKGINLNDRKLQEWITNIEVWAQDARGRQQTEVVRQRGSDRAQTPVRGKKK